MEAAASAGASAEDADTDMEPEACPSLASVVAASSVPPTRCSGTDHGPPNNNTSHLSNVNIPPQERYAVGDHCYFETSASGPYQVRRLEELVRDDNRIDVKVFVYSRKCDLPVAAQRHLCGYVDGEEELDEPAGSGVDGPVSLRLRRQRLSEYSPRELSEHRVASRELFLTHDAGGPIVETLPTALIRGKCRVLHHSPGLSKTEYTQRDDTFFCERVWFLPDGDRPGQLLVDREKRIHFDSKATFQAVIPPCRPHPPPDTAPDHATLLWTPGRLPEDTVETFVAVTVAVGLMARVKSDHGVNELPHVTAQLAGRDCMHTLAADILHQNGYDLKKAVAALVGNGRRLVSRRSLLETFDESDMQFFQLGLERTGRSLKMIHQDWLPWRKYADIVGFYYLYKGTDLYKEYRMMKATAGRRSTSPPSTCRICSPNPVCSRTSPRRSCATAAWGRQNSGTHGWGCPSTGAKCAPSAPPAGATGSATPACSGPGNGPRTPPPPRSGRRRTRPSSRTPSSTSWPTAARWTSCRRRARRRPTPWKRRTCWRSRSSCSRRAASGS
ncbi:metastasis-associated protein MTA3-like [Paramacrobiotus metropolitanus]|uniref:metastasis-associated protein MTA3-like n=1 Tax=Paramacrobiotus metropolitanus TaxID=2943436 RepID=UPI00244625DB|nr:metastasis-associated protein MTA3-like [Paramacrobiotus metropolitanus]